MPWPMDQANHAPSGEKSTLHVSQPARPSRDGGRRVFSSSTRAGSAAGRGRHGVSGGSRTRIPGVRLQLTSINDDVTHLSAPRWFRWSTSLHLLHILRVNFRNASFPRGRPSRKGDGCVRSARRRERRREGARERERDVLRCDVKNVGETNRSAHFRFVPSFFLARYDWL